MRDLCCRVEDCSFIWAWGCSRFQVCMLSEVNFFWFSWRSLSWFLFQVHRSVCWPRRGSLLLLLWLYFWLSSFCRRFHDRCCPKSNEKYQPCFVLFYEFDLISHSLIVPGVGVLDVFVGRGWSLEVMWFGVFADAGGAESYKALSWVGMVVQSVQKLVTGS